MSTGDERSAAAGAALLKTEGLTKMFGGVRAVDEVDFEVKFDEMRCVIGPNGCGKTTLFNLMTGYLPPTAGMIRFLGEDISGLPMHRIARAGLVRKFQVPSVFPGLTVAANIEAAAQGKLGRDRDREHAYSVDRLLTTIRLDQRRQQLAGDLAHGQKQWLELAMVLATAPRLILLDEPAAGMTKTEKSETVRLLQTVREETRVSALVIEHDMDFVEALDCPVSVMIMGRMVVSGSYAEIRDNPMIREAYLGANHG
jgi:ABC-type uncharacterized transport system ATPase subunit